MKKKKSLKRITHQQLDEICLDCMDCLNALEADCDSCAIRQLKKIKEDEVFSSPFNARASGN